MTYPIPPANITIYKFTIFLQIVRTQCIYWSTKLIYWQSAIIVYYDSENQQCKHV